MEGTKLQTGRQRDEHRRHKRAWKFNKRITKGNLKDT